MRLRDRLPRPVPGGLGSFLAEKRGKHCFISPFKPSYFKIADPAIVGKMLLEIGRKVRDASASAVTLIRFSPRHEDAQLLGK